MSPDILIVDDNAPLRAMIAQILQEDGYSTHEAADGLDALEYLILCVASAERTGQPALPKLILLDLMMPRMNGWEVRQQLVKDPTLAEVPVIVMTAHREAPTSQERVQAWLLKPVRYEDLLRVVRRCCGEHPRPDGRPAYMGRPTPELQDQPVPAG